MGKRVKKMSKYISAEKFVNKILENKLMSRESVAMRIFEIIKNLPSVDVAEIKHGKWEYTALVDCELSEVKCSNCKFKITSTADIAVEFSEYNFCPNCGARMNGNNNG